MPQSLHILVTGGCGYVGTVLTQQLLNDGHHVTAYDIQDGQTNAYGAYDSRNFDDLMYWTGNGTSESSHWMEYFIEYSGLGGQIGINWSNF